MLRQVAEGVLIHQSEFSQTNAVVVQGRAGVLLIDPGVRGDEMACLANDLTDLGQPVVAGFSTHPHWDHLLWHASLGAAPRYGTARCAATVRARLSDPHAKARIAQLIPPDIVEETPLDLLGLITGLPAETARFLGMALKSGLSSIAARSPGARAARGRASGGVRPLRGCRPSRHTRYPALDQRGPQTCFERRDHRLAGRPAPITIASKSSLTSQLGGDGAPRRSTPPAASQVPSAVRSLGRDSSRPAAI